MARGPKPKKQKTVEEFAKDVANEVLDNSTGLTIQQIKEKIDEEADQAFQQIRELESTVFNDLSNKEYDQWDVRKDDEIPYFDSDLTYEITGYRPITETRGLDFDPSWFTETRDVKLRTGKYCAYPPGTKKYADFWNEQFRRCQEGYVSHGYRLTGDHYFFLNFYRLKSTNTKMAGQGRTTTYPSFFSKQYEYFHYVELCKVTRHDVCALKARGVN